MPFQITRGRAAAALLAGTLVAVGGLNAVTSESGRTATAGPAPAASAPHTAPAAVSVDRALLRSFAVLRREATARDSLGGRTRGMPTSDYHGALVKRLATSAPSGDGLPRVSEGFVAPGPGGTLCLLHIAPGFDGPGGTCLPADEALAGQLTMAVDAGQGFVEVAGVVPDGITDVSVRTDRGAVARMPVVGNAFGALVQGAPVALRLRGRDGRLRAVRY